MHSRRGPPTAAPELLFNDVFLHHKDLILLVELILGHLLYNHPIEGPSHQCQRPRCGFVRIARCIGRSRAGGRARSQGHDTATLLVPPSFQELVRSFWTTVARGYYWYYW